MDSFISLDIETTGLDAQSDAIIEVAAVRFNDRRVEEEFSTLINPGRPLTPFISNLTGITDQMLRDAPRIQEVLPQLAAFVGNSPIVGHNVRFDLGFLRRQRILSGNEAIDTYELAAVLLPTAGRYNLGSLGQLLGIPLPATHRALDDARVCRVLYQKLYEMALTLPLQVLGEIVHLAGGMNWDGQSTFQRALKARSKETMSARQAKEGLLGPLFDRYETRNLPPLNPNKELYALNVDEVSAILEHGGLFSQTFPNYEHRPPQVAMLRAVTEALNEGRHLLVEAGTGTGKSMAYLVPAALWALQNNARVVVSTNTINLQDQLIHKDLPDLRKALGADLRATIVKGRSNYLCPRRLESMRRRGPENADEMRVLSKVMVWLQSSASGDRSEINLNGPVEREVWMRLSAEDDACTNDTCLKRTGGACPFYRLRQAAQSAHILVVNHALLLADIATGNRVLPEYQYLIIDEGHHIEDATTNALGFSAQQQGLEQLLRELGGPNAGALGRLLTALQGVILPSDYAAASEMVQRASDQAFHFGDTLRLFFQAIDHFLFEQREGRPAGAYAQQERILAATRTLPVWIEVETAWDDASLPLKGLVQTLGQLLTALGEVIDLLNEEGQEAVGGMNNLYRRLSETQTNLNGMVFNPDPNIIYWIEQGSGGRRISLNTAPLHIGPLMQRHLWNEKQCIILTSATLTAANEFDYLRSRLYAEDAYEMTVGSPYDYETAALLYVANDVPEPNDRHGHQRAVEQGILQAAQAAGGRTLALFTSYDQLKKTSQAITPLLARQDIRVYEQGDGASPHALLENFRSDERAVLLGTRSFWEGVDLPGEALQALVIAKLPFAVPSDPIVAARSETFEDSFNQYSLPEAILRFRQGFGRLIRSQSDRGIVIILDRRVMTKRYGKLFLDSLPACTLKVGPLGEVGRLTKQWLNL